MNKYLLSAFLLLVLACSSTPHDVQESNRLPKIYPDYIDVTIPVGIAPLNFAIADPQVTTVDVVVRGAHGGKLHANGKDADFNIKEWHQLLTQNKGADLYVEVCAERDGRWTRYRDFRIHVSNQPLDEWGLTYRLIPPSYAMYSKMGIYQRDLSNFEETPLIVNTAIPNQCVNCHTPNQTNPDQYVFHVRGEHGATVIRRNGKIELLKAKNELLGGSMVYPYWHPKGRFCAFSTNKTLQMFHAAAKSKRIEVYDSESDIFVYDTQRHSILRDTLLMRKEWAENTPVFSPDGKWLYFITARRQNYPADYNKERYSLCRVAFDSMSGRFGTQVDTLINARTMGKSVTWPRPSYDGRYLLYTQIDYGYFSVWHPESDLWILNLKTMQTYPLTAANSKRTESLHAWTKNSKWFLFTSRRDDGLYTRIYLSSIDRQGRTTKPFMLPQRHPKEYYRLLLYSYNTPDFTLRPVDSDAFKLQHDIESEHRISTQINQ